MSSNASSSCDKGRIMALVSALLTLRSEDECREFLADLCTPAELAAMASRWEVVHRIAAGTPYRQIQKETCDDHVKHVYAKV